MTVDFYRIAKRSYVHEIRRSYDVLYAMGRCLKPIRAFDGKF